MTSAVQHAMEVVIGKRAKEREEQEQLSETTLVAQTPPTPPPKTISGDIIEGVYFSRMSANAWSSVDHYVLIKICVVNDGRETTTKSWGITLFLEGAYFTAGEAVEVPSGLTITDSQGATEAIGTGLDQRSVSGPLTHVGITGWILFKIYGWEPENIKRSDVCVNIVDVRDGEHQITRRTGKWFKEKEVTWPSNQIQPGILGFPSSH